MKSYSVFGSPEPLMMEAKTLEDTLQDNNLFGGRQIKTSFRLISDDYYGFEYFDVEHSFSHPRPGRALILETDGMKEVKFSEYLEDIVFPAYRNPKESILLMSTKKEVAQDVFRSISERPKLQSIKLERHEIDFDVLEPLIGEYKSVWFNGMKSGGLHTASLSGTSLKDHPHFQDYKNSGGKLSFVTIPFVYDGAVHPIGLTKDSGILLQQKYDNIRSELDLVTSVYQDLLKKVWAAQEQQKPIKG